MYLVSNRSYNPLCLSPLRMGNAHTVPNPLTLTCSPCVNPGISYAGPSYWHCCQDCFEFEIDLDIDTTMNQDYVEVLAWMFGLISRKPFDPILNAGINGPGPQYNSSLYAWTYESGSSGPAKAVYMDGAEEMYIYKGVQKGKTSFNLQRCKPGSAPCSPDNMTTQQVSLFGGHPWCSWSNDPYDNPMSQVSYQTTCYMPFGYGSYPRYDKFAPYKSALLSSPAFGLSDSSTTDQARKFATLGVSVAMYWVANPDFVVGSSSSGAMVVGPGPRCAGLFDSGECAGYLWSGALLSQEYWCTDFSCEGGTFFLPDIGYTYDMGSAYGLAGPYGLASRYQVYPTNGVARPAGGDSGYVFNCLDNAFRQRVNAPGNFQIETFALGGSPVNVLSLYILGGLNPLYVTPKKAYAYDPWAPSASSSSSSSSASSPWPDTISVSAAKCKA